MCCFQYKVTVSQFHSRLDDNSAVYRNNFGPEKCAIKIKDIYIYRDLQKQRIHTLSGSLLV